MRFKGLLILFLQTFAIWGALPVGAQVPPSLASETWKKHFVQDLLPFWITPEALGDPIGNFPTVRTMSGKLTSDTRRLPRMLGRQTFFYAVGFALTGDPKLFEYAQKGAYWLMEKAWDKENGGFYFDLKADGSPADARRARFTQDIAYAAQGIAAYYYISRDPAAEAMLLGVNNLIFDADKFWDAENRRVRDGMDYYMKRERDQEGGGWELVALLDQVNAYMVLVQPVLSAAADRDTWAQRMLTLGESMVQHFWREDGIFAGQKNHQKNGGGRHVDFGHTFKTYWMLYLMDQRLGTQKFTPFVLKESAKWIDIAFDDRTGLWGSGPMGTDSARFGSSWWIYVECNQYVSTLNVKNGKYQKLLARTAQGWLDYYVDKKWGEVYSGIQWDGQPSAEWEEESTSKVWDWKNGFHSAEHALIMYLMGTTLEKKNAQLFFAVPTQQVSTFKAVPYIFTGAETSRKAGESWSDAKGKWTKVSVSFKDIGL